MHKRCGVNTPGRDVWRERSLPFSFLISSFANLLFLRTLARQHHPHPLQLRLPSCFLPLNLLSFILTWMFIFTRLRIGTPMFASIKICDHFDELCLSVHVHVQVHVHARVQVHVRVHVHVRVQVRVRVGSHDHLQSHVWVLSTFRAVGDCVRLERCPVHTDLRLQLLERSLQLLRDEPVNFSLAQERGDVQD